MYFPSDIPSALSAGWYTRPILSFLSDTCVSSPNQVEVVTGILDTFIVEPFVPHEQSDEYYVCINSNREGEEILFFHEGGVDIGDVDAKADRLQVREPHNTCR